MGNQENWEAFGLAVAIVIGLTLLLMALASQVPS